MHLHDVTFFAANTAHCHIKYDEDSKKYPYTFYINSKDSYTETPNIALHMSSESFDQFKKDFLNQLEAVEKQIKNIKKEGE